MQSRQAYVGNLSQMLAQKVHHIIVVEQIAENGQLLSKGQNLGRMAAVQFKSQQAQPREGIAQQRGGLGREEAHKRRIAQAAKRNK